LLFQTLIIFSYGEKRENPFLTTQLFNMANITGILCQILTSNVSGAGTDGNVYLGIGGREFRLDSSADDYEKNSFREYILGRAPLEPNLPAPQVRVNNKENNDPRNGYQLDTSNLNKFPVYIRFEPVNSDDNWNLRFTAVLVYTGASQFNTAYTVSEEFENLWLGKSFGKIVYLIELDTERGVGILEKGYEMANHISRKV